MTSPDDSEALPSWPMTPEESYYLEFATKEPVDSLARLDDAAPPRPAKPFFRTKKGIVALVLLSAGVAWAVHASRSERVASPLR